MNQFLIPLISWISYVNHSAKEVEIRKTEVINTTITTKLGHKNL